MLPKSYAALWKRRFSYALYRLDNFFTRGALAQGVLLFVLTGIVIFIGACAVFFGLYGPENKEVAGIGRQLGEGFLDAVWWSTMHIFDYSYISQNYGATWPIICFSLFVSLMGMVIFGALTGFITTLFDARLTKLASGNQPVRESGHILILGWNDKIFSILDLLEDYHKNLKVVVLSNHSIAAMTDLMRTERALIKRVRPILRTGSPNSLVELERMAFRDAYSIIVLSDQSDQANPDEDADIRTIKTLMHLAGNLPDTLQPRPKMVAEILRGENMDVARIAARRSISLICSSEVLSRMIVQSSRQPGLAYVYNEIFGFAGSEIYVQPHPRANNRLFGDILYEFPDAIPIGTSRFEMRQGKPYYAQNINPGKDYVVPEGDWLILIARDANIVHAPGSAKAPDTDFVATESRKFLREKILILGWNRNLFNILTEYDSFLAAGSEILVVSLYSDETAAALIKEGLPTPLTNATVRHVNLDYVDNKKLEPLLHDQHSTVIVLADESSGEKDTDARAIVTILLLQDFEERHPDKHFRQVVSEIAANNNSELLRHHSKTDIIVSPRLISMLLTQVSQQLMLERVYANLMNAHANEIYLKSATRYTRRLEKCTFADIMRGATKLGEVAIGVKLAADAKEPSRNHGVRINPPKDEIFHLGEKDEVIVISTGGRAREKALSLSPQ